MALIVSTKKGHWGWGGRHCGTAHWAATCYASQHLSSVPVWVLAAVFPVQLLADPPGKAFYDGPIAWIPSMHVGDVSRIPGSLACRILEYCSHLGYEPEDRRSASLLPLSVTVLQMINVTKECKRKNANLETWQ